MSGSDETESASRGGEDAPLLEAVARNVPIVLFALDGDGTFTRSEGRGLEALGLETDEVVGESVFDVYADHPGILRAVERALDGENVKEVHEIGDSAFEAWYRPKGDGRVERVLGVAVDVTERVRHGRRLERLNEASRRLLEAGPKGAVAERVVEIARGVLDQPYTGVWFHDPGEDELVSVAGEGPARDLGHDTMGADSVEMDVFRSGDVRFVENYAAVERPAFPGAPVETVLLIPLGDHGLLTVASHDVVEIDAAGRDLIEILARDATVAFDRAKREHLLERLNEATRELMVAESEAEIAARIVEINRQVLDEPASVVWFLDRDSGVLEPVAGTNEEVAEGGPARPFWELPPIERGTAEMDAFVEREPTFLEDYHAVENPAHPGTELGAILAVPIGDRGLLTVGAPTAEDIGAETPDLVEILARDAAVAMDRVERESALAHLHDVTRALMAAETREEIAGLAVDATEDVLGHPMAVFRLVSPDGDRLEPVAHSAWIREHIPERPSFPAGQGSIGTVFERGEVARLDRSELDDLDLDDTTRALLCLPVGGHGVLTIGETEPAAFDDSDVQLAKVLASNVEAALDRIDRELELERRNERLDQFASIVSHDLRNPLSVVSGQVDIADVEEPYRTPIESAVERMQTIIDDVLALARQGRIVTDPEPTNLQRVAEDAWASVETEEASLSVEADVRIVADRERLQGLLENLIRNSVEHGSTGSRNEPRSGDSVEHGSVGERAGPEEGDEDGPSTVSVRIGAIDGCFVVEDDGRGIPADDRESILEAGFTTAESGTGLGLAIVSEIAEAHGWTLSVGESPEGGARFSVTGVEQA